MKHYYRALPKTGNVGASPVFLFYHLHKKRFPLKPVIRKNFCNFAAIVSKGKKNIVNSLHKISAMLIVMLMLFINLVQLLHAHTPIVTSPHADGDQYHLAAEKCSVCDYFIHRQIQGAPVDAIQIPEPLNRTAIPKGWLILSAYKRSIPGFSNKGPPVSA